MLGQGEGKLGNADKKALLVERILETEVARSGLRKPHTHGNTSTSSAEGAEGAGGDLLVDGEGPPRPFTGTVASYRAFMGEAPVPGRFWEPEMEAELLEAGLLEQSELDREDEVRTSTFSLCRRQSVLHCVAL